jgi:hypothetical protein
MVIGAAPGALLGAAGMPLRGEDDGGAVREARGGGSERTSSASSNAGAGPVAGGGTGDEVGRRSELGGRIDSPSILGSSGAGGTVGL